MVHNYLGTDHTITWMLPSWVPCANILTTGVSSPRIILVLHCPLFVFLFDFQYKHKFYVASQYVVLHKQKILISSLNCVSEIGMTSQIQARECEQLIDC
jgi:hypothetical protein